MFLLFNVGFLIMLDFVFVLLFPNDFLVFYSVFFGYFVFWFVWEFFNGFGFQSCWFLFSVSFSVYLGCFCGAFGYSCLSFYRFSWL